MATDFIKHNFPLFGFSSAESAIFQAIKELVDNSFDALKLASAEDPTSSYNVKITIKTLSSTLLEVDVADNGCGMVNVLGALNCFNTTKSSLLATGDSLEQLCLSGRFGVGLSAVFLYTSLETSCSLMALSKTKSMPQSALTDVCLDEQTGQARALSHALVDVDSFVNGTKLRVCLPYHAQFVQKSLWSVQKYLLLWNLLPNNCFGVEIEIFSSADRLSTFVGKKVYSGCSSLLGAPMALLGYEILYSRELLAKIKRHLSQRHEAPVFCATKVIRWESSAMSSDGLVAVSACIVVGAAAGSAEAEAGGLLGSANAPRPCDWLSKRPSIHLHLMRYANSVPLVDKSDDCMSCSIWSAVQAVCWQSFGYNLIVQSHGMRIDVDTCNPIDCAVSGICGLIPDDDTAAGEWNEESASGWPTALGGIAEGLPRCELRPLDQPTVPMTAIALHSSGTSLSGNGSEERGRMESKETVHLLLVVDVIQQSTSYATMRKSSLAHTAGLQGTTAQAITTAISDLKISCQHTGLFALKTRQREEEIETINVPAVAAGIAKIIQFSSLKCLEIVHGSAENAASVPRCVDAGPLQSHIAAKLLEVYRRLECDNVEIEQEAEINFSEPQPLKLSSKKKRKKFEAPNIVWEGEAS